MTHSKGTKLYLPALSPDDQRRPQSRVFCTWFRSLLGYNFNYVCGFIKGDGFITTAVLRDILAALDDKLTAEDLDGIIEEVDEDGSGTVDFEGNF